MWMIGLVPRDIVRFGMFPNVRFSLDIPSVILYFIFLSRGVLVINKKNSISCFWLRITINITLIAVALNLIS